MNMQAVGACWYLLGIQRTAECLMGQCTKTESCRLSALSCEKSFFLAKSYQVKDNMRLLWGNNNDARSFCLQGSDQYDYGAFDGITNQRRNCDRVKSIFFTKREIITKEGDPVQRILFIVRGHLQCRQAARNGVWSCCMLGPGSFSGDELLSWCVRKPFIERLPPSSSMLITLDATEAFALEADDMRYVTQHFRVNDKVKMIARYYSPGWRTWAAVSIQLAWFLYRHRQELTSLSFIRPRRPLSRSASEGEDRLRIYTALLTSPKPHSDDIAP